MGKRKGGREEEKEIKGERGVVRGEALRITRAF